MRRLLLPITLATLATAPAHAVTHKDVSYAVHYEGAGKYQKIDREDYPGGDWHEEEINLQFTFSGDIGDGVVFRDGHPFDKSGTDLGDDTVTGDIQYRGNGSGMTCPVQDDSFATGWMRLMEDQSEVVPLDGETHLWLRPFEQWEVIFDCGGSHPGALLADVNHMNEAGEIIPGKHTFDTPLSLPGEVFGMGYIEQLIPLQVVQGERCPGALEHSTTKCRLEWSGKIIFRKLWENEVRSDSGVLPPSTGPGDKPKEVPLPPPAPPKPPVLEEDDWLVPLVQQSTAKVDASGSSASVTVTCPAGCSGDIELVPLAASGARAAAVRKPLARANFRVPAGKPTTVRVKLGRKARTSLRRAKRAQLRLKFAKPVKRTRTFTVRVPRR